MLRLSQLFPSHFCHPRQCLYISQRSRWWGDCGPARRSWCLSSHLQEPSAAWWLLVRALPASARGQSQQLVEFIVCLLLICSEPSGPSCWLGPHQLPPARYGPLGSGCDGHLIPRPESAIQPTSPSGITSPQHYQPGSHTPSDINWSYPPQALSTGVNSPRNYQLGTQAPSTINWGHKTPALSTGVTSPQKYQLGSPVPSTINWGHLPPELSTGVTSPQQYQLLPHQSAGQGRISGFFSLHLGAQKDLRKLHSRFPAA